MKLHQHVLVMESLDRARTLLRADRAAAALGPALEAVRIDPGCADGRLLLSQIHLKLGQADLALAALDAATQYEASGHGRLDFTLARAKALMADGRDLEALPLLNSLIEQCPGDAQLHRLASASSERAGDIDAASRHMQQVVALEPGDRAAARMLARLLAPTDPAAGLRFIDAADCDEPEPSRQSSPAQATQWQTTQWMRQSGRLRDAEENYRQLLPQSPDDAALWIEAGEHADRLGALEVARERLIHAAQIAGDHLGRARTSLARSRMHAGDFAGAIWWWWKAANCGPTDDAEHAIDCWASLAVCALSADRAHLVELSQRRLQALANDDDQMLAMADAWLHGSSGEVIRAATQQNATSLPTASPLTWILRQSADVLGEQARRKPGWADTLYHSAVCEAALGENAAAREHVQAALDLNPNYKAATTLAANLPKAA